MTKITHDIFKGMLFTALGYSFFSIGDAFIKYLGAFHSAIEAVFYVTVFLFCFLAGSALIRGNLKSVIHTDYLKLHITRGLLFTIGFLLFVYALQHLVLVKVYTLLFIMPLISTLLAIPLLKEKVGIQRLLTILFGFTGVLVVLRPGIITLELAAFSVLLSAVVFALFDIITRKIGKDEEKLTFVFYPAITIIITLGGLLLLQGKLFIPEVHYLAFFIAAGAGHFLGHLCTVRGYTLAPIAVAAPFQYIQLLWSIAIGYFFFAELPDIWTIIGGFIIVASGLLLIRQEVKNTKESKHD